MKKSRGIRKSVQKTRKDRKGLRYRKSKKGKRTMRKKIRRSKVGGSGREDDIKRLVEFMASYDDDDDESGEIRLAAPVDVVDEALEKAEKRQKKKGVPEKKVGTKPPVDRRKGGANIGSNKEFPSLSKK